MKLAYLRASKTDKQSDSQEARTCSRQFTQLIILQYLPPKYMLNSGK